MSQREETKSVINGNSLLAVQHLNVVLREGGSLGSKMVLIDSIRDVPEINSFGEIELDSIASASISVISNRVSFI